MRENIFEKRKERKPGRRKRETEEMAAAGEGFKAIHSGHFACPRHDNMEIDLFILAFKILTCRSAISLGIGCCAVGGKRKQRRLHSWRRKQSHPNDPDCVLSFGRPLYALLRRCRRRPLFMFLLPHPHHSCPFNPFPPSLPYSAFLSPAAMRLLVGAFRGAPTQRDVRVVRLMCRFSVSYGDGRRLVLKSTRAVRVEGGRKRR